MVVWGPNNSFKSSPHQGRLNSGVSPAMRQILVFAFLSLFCGSTSARHDVMPACSSTLTPTVTVVPKLPPKLHNDFSGKAVATFIVDVNGYVQSASILSSEWRPHGRTRTNSAGYNDVVLSAVTQWQYPPQAKSCRHQAPFEFIFDGGPISTSGRSNNSFKPSPHQGGA